MGIVRFLPRYKLASNQLAAAVAALCCSSVACRCLAVAYASSTGTTLGSSSPHATLGFNFALAVFAITSPVAAFCGVALVSLRFDEFKRSTYITDSSPSRFELRIRGLLAREVDSEEAAPSGSQTQASRLGGPGTSADAVGGRQSHYVPDDGDDVIDQPLLAIGHKGSMQGQGPVVGRHTVAAVHAEFQAAMSRMTDPSDLLMLKLHMARFTGCYERNLHLEMYVLPPTVSKLSSCRPCPQS